MIKVYGGRYVQPAHPPGTLKLSTAISAGGLPNNGAIERFAVIFVDGSESCAVTMWNKPDAIGYKLVCGAGTFEAVGANPYKNVVDQINLLDYFVASGGSTWELPNATATGDQVCYVVTPSNLQTLTVPVMEDVTTGPNYANAVFPDVTIWRWRRGTTRRISSSWCRRSTARSRKRASSCTRERSRSQKARAGRCTPSRATPGRSPQELR
jgi:hypothetical protein